MQLKLHAGEIDVQAAIQSCQKPWMYSHQNQPDRRMPAGAESELMAVNQTRRIIVSMAALAAVLVCAASAAAQNAKLQSAAANPEATRAQGANHWKSPDEVYDKICKFCHDTGIGPDLKGKKYSSQLTFAMVRIGPGAMPAFRQTDIDDATLKRLGELLQNSEAPKPPNSASPTYIAPPPSITAPVKAKTVPQQ